MFQARILLCLWSLQDKILMAVGMRQLNQALRIRERFDRLPGLCLTDREIDRLERLLQVCRQVESDSVSTGTRVTNDDDEVWSERAAGDDPAGARDNRN
jgi:hypothetical protein